ncbi:MFS transporter [Nocardioides nitrophenolicus]|uniref:MFS transporter n=1 Tax=Nocardioides nitrophenolicus TaxID=60489 RepID=UPI0019598023|nr:MFS transporter [Nocardioides nitrophenolicus]MBM7517542.1 putative MFS family arabinose efflux permease [Nocardioides nitrophenolicus]
MSAASGDPARSRTSTRLVIAFIVTNTIGYGALIQSFTVLLVPMSADLGASRTAVAFAATLSTLVGAFTAVPIGRMLDRYGGRLIMTLGTVVGVAGVGLWATAHSLPHLYLAFTLIGFSLAASTYESAFAVLVVATDERRRDTAIVVVTMITGFATSFFYPLTGWLDGQIGWRPSLLVLGAALAVTAIPLHAFVVPSRAMHSALLADRSGVRLGEALRNSRFWLLLVAFVLQGGANAAFLLLMVTYFRDVGFSAGTAASLPLAVGILQLTSRLALAPLAARFGMTRVTAVSFAVQGVGMLVLPLVGTSIPLTLMCIAFFGLGYGISVVARPSIVADIFGVTTFASILSVMTVPMAVSRAGAPLVATWLQDWRFLVVMGLACVLSAAALVPLIGARRAAPAAASVDVMPEPACP